MPKELNNVDLDRSHQARHGDGRSLRCAAPVARLMSQSKVGSRATRRAFAVKVSGLAGALLVAVGIGVSGCQPQGRSSASSGSAATTTVIASQGSPAVAPAPDPSVYDTKLVPPRMGQNPRNNHVLILEGTLPPRGRVTKPFILPKLATMSVLLVGDGARYSFRSPHGETIIPGETKGRPGLQYVEGAEGAGFTLDAPEQGAWSLVLESKSDRRYPTLSIFAPKAGPRKLRTSRRCFKTRTRVSRFWPNPVIRSSFEPL